MHSQTVVWRHLGVLLLALAVVPMVSRADMASPKAPPNVVLFLVDDMGWMDTTVNGSRFYETPNMERLAKRAMRFTRAYATQQCSPTRACILTGKTPLRHGITTPSGHSAPRRREIANKASPASPMIYPIPQSYLEPSEYTLAEALRDAGYRTGHFGKWHLGLQRSHWPEQQGFDVAFHAEPSASPSSYFSPYGVKSDGEPGATNFVGTITDGPPGEYITDRLTEEAIRFISAGGDRPFFLNLWHYAVHGPWGFKEDYARMFMGREDPRGKQGNAIMAAMLKSMDESLGRVLDTLDAFDLTDNTLFIFFSDNGGNDFSCVDKDPSRSRKNPSEHFQQWTRYAGNRPPTCNDPLRAGKGTIYEGGLRVPLMIAWPGMIPPGSVSHAVVHAIDLYPTLLDALGIAPDPRQKMDGISLMPVLRQTGTLAREGVFTYFPHSLFGVPPGMCVHAGEWKLIRWFETNEKHPLPHELYHLGDDIGETRNLAEKHPETVKRLDALLDGFLAGGDVVPKPNPAYRPVVSVEEREVGVWADWKPQNCGAVLVRDALRVTAMGAPSFLGISNLELAGPVTIRLFTRGKGGGARLQWRTADQDAFPPGQVVDFQLPASAEGCRMEINVPVKGALKHMRLYLPVQEHPLDLIRLEALPSSGRPRSWASSVK